MMIRGLLFISILSLFSLSSTAYADLVFSAPPREKVEAGEKLYTPIAKKLSELLGEQVRYEYPKDWLTYSRRMREGDFDIIFDGPQFASWRMAHIDHVPLVRIQGDLRFVVVVGKNSGLHELSDLAAKKICALASPNLGTISMLHAFNNPAQQPILVEARGGMKGIYKRLNEGQCDAAILRDSFFNSKMSKEEQNPYHVIWSSTAMPNQTITASRKIPLQLRQQIIAALSNDTGSMSALPLFQRFSNQSTHFIPANENEFKGLNDMLEGVVWGW
jgi:ABC-type phosphate/phosphonate transport system substrate-binding protein